MKLIVNLKGRESELKNNAIDLIRRFRDDVGEVCVCDMTRAFMSFSTTFYFEKYKTIVMCS